MAEAQQQTPAFKLVLVGDGGTGKVIFPFVSIILSYRLWR